MPSARIQVKDNFRKLGEGYSKGAKRALGKTAGVTVSSARGFSSGYNIGGIISETRVSPAHKTSRGWQILVYTPDFRATFFEFGTYGRRRKALKRSRRSTQSNKGVKAQHFLAHAGKEARAVLLAEVRRELG